LAKLGIGTKVTILAGIVTIALGGPAFFEEYNKTFPIADTKGDFDLSHPFYTSLVIHNPSSVFDMHFVEARCQFAAIWIMGSEIGDMPPPA
jgi:hypothetical protein